MARKPVALTTICAAVALIAAAPAGATFPGRNGRIAYSTDEGISTVRPNGTDVTPLLDFPGARDPAWSPDGRRLAFAAQGSDGHSHVYTVSEQGKGLRRATRLGVDRWDPSWGPGGKRLLVQGRSAADADPALYLVKLANREERSVPVAGLEEPIASAEWAPDGSAIAFTAFDLYLVSPSGGTPAKLTQQPHGTEEEQPDGTIHVSYDRLLTTISWAPGSKRIAFSQWVNCPCDDEFDLGVIGRDGSNRHDFQTSQTARHPLWSPNARSIDFCGYWPYQTPQSLWSMAPDGTARHEVLNGAGCDAAWQALP